MALVGEVRLGKREARDIAQQLGAFGALEEDLGSVPSIYIMTHYL